LGVMLMKITTVSEISDVFSIFHDGIIEECVPAGDDIRMRIEIRYLAMWIRSDYTHFILNLSNVTDVAFRTWPSDLKSEPQDLYDPSVIFSPKLEILESSANDQLVTVVCKQASPDFEYGGGELVFRASAASVADQGGDEVSLDRLDRICKEYWEEWSVKNQH